MLSRRFRRFALYCGAIAVLSFPSANLMAQGPQKPALQSQPSGRTSDASKAGSLPDQRAEWFHRQRASPRTSIPKTVREQAVTHARQMAAHHAALSAPGAIRSDALPLFGPLWTPIGPQPIVTNIYAGGSASGRVTALVVDPSNSDIVYMGAAQGGVWKTTQGSAPNALWAPLTDTLPSLAMGALAVDPTTCTATGCSTIYAGTGEEDFSGDSYFGAGIFKSTDGGQTWASLAGTITNVSGIGSFTGPFDSGVGGARFSSLAVDPNNPQHILAAAQIFLNVNGGASSGIYRSTDGGNTWAIVQGGGAGIDIAADSAHIGTFYATLGSPGGSTGNGAYKSTDDGVTWLAINGAAGSSIPAGASAGRIAMGFSPSSGGAGTLYAGIQDPTPGPNRNNLLGFFKSTDGGAHWTNLPNTPSYCNPQCWYDNVIRTQPSDASGNTVYVGGSADSGGSFATLYRSTDGGNSWTNVSASANGAPLIHTDVHALAFAADSSLLYVGNDGGVWVTSDLPTSGTAIPNWTNLNATLQITQFYPSMSIHPSNPQIGLGGTQDNNTLLYENANWTPVTCGDGGWTIIDPVIPSTVYAACTRSTLLRSAQGGSSQSFFPANSGIDPTDPVSFIAPFVIDPVNNQQLYFGTNRLWETTDGANSWTAASGTLTTAPTGFLTAIAAAPASGGQRIVYVGTVGGLLWVSTPFSAGQPSLSQRMSGLPSRSVTQIVIDPSDPTGQTAYATYSGFSGIYPSLGGGDMLGHIFKTSTAGGFWTDVSCHAADCSAPGVTDLPNTPANDLVVDPDDPAHNTLYAATDVGVFETTDAGVTWNQLNNGLPNVAVLSLRLHDPSRTLRAATHGRGAWDLPLPALTGTAPFRISSITPTNADAGTTQVTLTVGGAGFTASSQVQWNASNSGINTNTSSAPTQLVATIPGNLLATAGAVSVTVTDPGQANPTNSTIFTIAGLPPILNQIQPTSAHGGMGANPGVLITLTGSQFEANAQVEMDGSSFGITTTFQSSTSLTAFISPDLFTFGGVHQITVVNPPPGGGPSGAQLFTVTTMGAPANDNFANAIAINSALFTSTVDNSNATTESTDPTPPCVPHSTNPRTKTVWYAFSAGASGDVTLDTIGSSYDTTLSVWTASGGAGKSLQFANVACNDDITQGVFTQSKLTFAATAGTTYYVMVAPFGPPDGVRDQAGGKTVLNAPGAAASTISAAPIFASVAAGNSANFTITQGSRGPTLALVCSGLPAGATCAQAAVGPVSTATLSISTMSRGEIPSLPGKSRPIRIIPPARARLLATLLIIALLPFLSMRHRRRILYALPWAALLMVILLSTTGCGSNGSGSGGGGGGGNGTPAGTYPIVVTGTSGSTTQTTTVILQVN